jgi:hypothetical protein
VGSGKNPTWSACGVKTAGKAEFGAIRGWRFSRPWFSLMAKSMATFTANSDYEEKDSDPIYLQPGDEIHVGAADRTWPGWVWATDGSGNDGYIPEEILKPLGDGRFQATEAFDPSVLTIRRGDRLESLRQIHGWHWCRSEGGAEGWVAGYLLRPL